MIISLFSSSEIVTYSGNPTHFASDPFKNEPGLFPSLRTCRIRIGRHLLPVFHQSDLPLAGDLFSVMWWGALHGARGRSHHDALGQARVGRTQLVGRYVSCGSYWGEMDKSVRTPRCFHLELILFTSYSITQSVSSHFPLEIIINTPVFHQRMFDNNFGQERLSALLPVLRDEFPLTTIVLVNKYLFWNDLICSFFLSNLFPGQWLYEHVKMCAGAAGGGAPEC